MSGQRVVGGESGNKQRTVTIDVLPDSAYRYLDYDAVVCIDIILTSTTAVTAAAQGRRALAARTADEAVAVARRLERPLLADELGGSLTGRFEFVTGPSALQRRADVERPIVLMGSPGAELLANTAGAPTVYVSCFRNLGATANTLIERHNRVAIIGAGATSDYRCEDQIAAAWLGSRLIEKGFMAEDIGTLDLLARWGQVDFSLAALGKSAEELRRRGGAEDLGFVLSKINDLDTVCRYQGGEIVSGDDAAPEARVA